MMLLVSWCFLVNCWVHLAYVIQFASPRDLPRASQTGHQRGKEGSHTPHELLQMTLGPLGTDLYVLNESFAGRFDL